MTSTTADLWAKQDRHEGDRWRVFSAVADVIDAATVLYPGCYVDLAPSFVFPSVMYVDEHDGGIGYTTSPFAYLFARIA